MRLLSVAFLLGVERVVGVAVEHPLVQPLRHGLLVNGRLQPVAAQYFGHAVAALVHFYAHIVVVVVVHNVNILGHFALDGRILAGLGLEPGVLHVLEGLGDFGAVLRLVCQQAPEHAQQPRREFLELRRHLGGAPLLPLAEVLVVGVLGEQRDLPGRVAGGAHKQHDGRLPAVGVPAAGEFLVGHGVALLRRQEWLPGALDFADLRALLACLAEVAQLQLGEVGCEDQHVLQLDVAVHQLLGVDELESRAQLEGDALAELLAEAARLDGAGEVAVRRVLLGEDVEVVRLEGD